MDKLMVRLFVVFTTLYFLYTYVMAWYRVDFFSDAYIIIAEIIICMVMSSQGKYHCEYMRITAYGLTASDSITRIDSAYNILSVDAAIVIPLSVIMLSVLISFIMALIHYYRVLKLKSKQHDIQ